jgi:hypothetical protein
MNVTMSISIGLYPKLDLWTANKLRFITLLKRKPKTARFERPVVDTKYMYWQSKQIAFHIAVCLILLFQH